jgi:serine/threonine-protein phosphatase 6 regulatory ankyrin repeat subunit B
MRRKPGISPFDLENALKTKDAAALSAYLDAGGDPNCRILSFSMTPVMYASLCGYLEGIEILVARGSNLKGTDIQGNSALHQAASFAGPEIIEALLKAGLDVNKKNNRGATPLMRAAGAAFNPERPGRYIAALDCLLANGANPRLTDKTGSNALFYAIEAQAQPGIERLLQFTPITSARYFGRRTALHHAAEKGQAEKIKGLLDLGIKLNAQGAEGYTALHVAVIETTATKKAATVAKLLECGIDRDIRDEKGATASDYAADKPDVLQVFAAYDARAGVDAILKRAQVRRSV